MFYQMCFKPISCPEQSGYNVGLTYRFPWAADESESHFSHKVYFRQAGEYKIEYWFVNDNGIETEHKEAQFIVQIPEKILQNGFQFVEQFREDAELLTLKHGRVLLTFKRANAGMGKQFQWTELDLSGIRISESAQSCAISIQTGTWISKKLNNEKCFFSVSVQQGLGLQYNSTVLLENDGQLNSAVPANIKNCVTKIKRNTDSLSFALHKSGTYIITCR